MNNNEIKNLTDAFINNTTALLYEKNLTDFYADYDFDSVENLNKRQIIKNSAYLITLFKDVDFNTIQVIKNDENRKADLLRTNPTLLNAFKDHNTNPINILSGFLDVLFIYKYCFENKRFYHIITFYFELLKNKFDRDKTKEPLKINFFSDFYFKGLEKDYLNNFILLLAPSQLNAYIDLLYDIKHYRETGEEIEHINNKTYFFNTRTDLKAYTEEFYNLMSYFIDFENKKPTAICFDTDKKETLVYNNDNILIINSQQKIKSTDKLNQYDNDSDAKALKHLKGNNIEEETEIKRKTAKQRRIIDKWRADHPDQTNITDEQILNYKNISYTQQTIEDLLKEKNLTEELKKYNLGIDIIKQGKTDEAFLTSQEKILTNIINMDDIELFKKYGASLVNVKAFIENKVYNFFRAFNKNINILNAQKEIIINPKEFNDFIGVNNDIHYTKDLIEQCLKLLTRKTTNLDFIFDKKYNVWKTPQITINKNKFLDEETKKELIKATNEASIEAHIEYNRVEHYIKLKDKETNQEAFFIRLTNSYINYLKLNFINNFYEIDNTNTIKRIIGQPNSKTPTRANFLKTQLFFNIKVDVKQRDTLKKNNYLQGEFLTQFYKIKEMFINADLLNIKRIEKDGYKKTIFKPIYETLELLKNNGDIDYYINNEKLNKLIQDNYFIKADKSKNIFYYLSKDETTLTKEIQEAIEKTDISITLLNDKN